ncbi:hypothetical protein L3Y34_010337 [Caenorhabditis briggsae]|uniref:PHD-type domain-containing protein n=1 Tax=Caenorhabditis briggsae TaxID=6238 RepID=A0AAE8ZLD4_CAEBR|nr:hypothetical protein L3Y34_010337 [Caenorhabditis briggsae]
MKWSRKRHRRFNYEVARRRKLFQMDSKKLISGHQFAVLKLQDSCKSIVKDFGFSAVSPAAINKLSAILRSKMTELSQQTRLLMEHAGRSQPIVEDAISTLKCKKINMADLIEYSKQVRGERLNSLPVFPTPDYELAKSEYFFHAMYGAVPSDRELETRPEHIPRHLRALHPDWIEDENRAVVDKVTKKVIKTAEDREEEEFDKLKRINTYRRNETPEAQLAREEKERREKEEAAYAKKRNRERYALGITSMKDTDLPNFEDMDYEAMGFFADIAETKRMEEERVIEEEKAKELLALIRPKPNVTTSSFVKVTSDNLVNSGWLGTSTSPPVQTFVSEVSMPVFKPEIIPQEQIVTSSVITTEDVGPTFKMSDLVKSKPLIKLSGTASNPGSAPTSRPGSAMSGTVSSTTGMTTGTPVKVKLAVGRPKKPKPEGADAVVSVPKPKGRPPKKATLEKRKRLSEQIIAQQQEKIDKFKEEKPEKPEKAEKPEKRTKKNSLAEEIRDQLLRARSQMVLPNSALPPPPPVVMPVVEAPPPITLPPLIIPKFNFDAIATDVPEVGATMEIDAAPILESPMMEIEITTDDPNAPLSAVSDIIPLDFPEVGEKKKKKEKRDKNSEEYKEYKKLKKERKRKEREERKAAEAQENPEKVEQVVEASVPATVTASAAAPAAAPEETPAMVTDPTTKNPKLKLKIKFGANYLPTTSSPAKESPMRPDSTSSANRPPSSKGHYQDEPPAAPPANPSTLKFRFKNLFHLSEKEEEKKERSKTPDTSRPGSSSRVESPSSGSSKHHHKKEKKDKEHKKHKKDKERSREEKQEREERKERELQKEEAARHEIEEKERREMESRLNAEEEEERRREKERRRAERKAEKERQKEKDRNKEKEERRERKEKEREAEREREREREREKERERKAEEEARKRKEEASAPPPPPTRQLISQTDDDSNESESDDEEIWICPVCSVAYTDGANMVGCDQCQDWFHWHCVGITAEPTDSKWFCNRCSKGNKSKKHGKRAGGPHDSESSAKRKKN